jgi:hypothetical protein
VRTILEAGVRAVHADNFESCVQSLDEAVAVYESNPSYVHVAHSHFPSLLLFVHAARSVSEERGSWVNTLEALSARLELLRQAIH